MPRVALAAYIAFILTAFVGRTWLQYRRTGDLGLRGFSGTPLSLERLAGVLFVLGTFASFLAPLLQLAGVLTPVGWLDRPAVQLAGLILFALGFAITLGAQLQMGDSWRIGVDSAEATRLVTQGIFGLVRNPIFTGMLGAGAGIALLAPNRLALLAALCGVFAIELQVRRVEEPYLLRTHGEPYRAYARRVGRFIPGVGLLDAR